MKTNKQLIENLVGFVGKNQLTVLKSLMRGEEGEWFKAKLEEVGSVIATMPKTYEQDGKGDEAIVYLHYFTGGCDWWVTEKDAGSSDDKPGTGQEQAFGLVDLGYGAELGYISLVEVLENGAEIDLHWTPITLAEVKAKRDK